MKIGIDITPITTDKAGIGYFTLSLVKALAEVDQYNSYHLFCNKELDAVALPNQANFKLRITESDKPNARWMIKIIGILDAENFDYFVSTSNFLWSVLFPKTIQIIHDIGPIIYPQFFGFKSAIKYSILLRLALPRADQILTISKTVALELTTLKRSLLNQILGAILTIFLRAYTLFKKNKVIENALKPRIRKEIAIDYLPLGVHDWTLQEKNSEYYIAMKERYNLPEKYFVSISTLEPRKNHINMLKGFAEFINSKTNPDYSEYKLVIVGKNGWFYNNIYKTVVALKITNNVIFTGYAPEEDLAGLLDLSQGSVMLSFYEGFGLPILESLTRKKPVLISDITVFKEITKGSQNVCFATPSDTNSIALGFKELSTKRFVSENIGLSEYSWQNCARKLLTSLSL